MSHELNWMNWRKHEVQIGDTVLFFDHMPSPGEVAQRILDNAGGVMNGDELNEAMKHVRIGVRNTARMN